MPRISDPIVPYHSVLRFAERFDAGRHKTDDEIREKIAELLRLGERWGPSTRDNWHVLAHFLDEAVVLAMVTDEETGRPLVRTVLTLTQATGNQVKHSKSSRYRKV